MQQKNYNNNLTHDFEPIFDKDSKILILGTFPSVKSRETGFYYGHKQNRFWKVIANLTNTSVPETISEKKEMLLGNNIAIWDVIQKCDIVGSSDSSIKNVISSDLSIILSKCDIKKIYANGSTAKKLYDKYQYPITQTEITGLPSTSPANAAFSLEKLILSWQEIKDYTGGNK